MKRTIWTLFINIIIIAGLFFAAEIAFRSLLFSKLSFMEGFREPEFYADWYSSDEAWKLHYLFGHWSGPRYPDPFLGWIRPGILHGSYQNDSAKTLGLKKPLLLYGDSFAEGFESKFFDYSLKLSESYSIINYGVYGYGLDQIYLLYKRSVGNFEHPTVIISLLDEDLDRSFLTVRDGPKPYFRTKDDALELCGVPVAPAPDNFFLTHPPRITSYLFSGAFRLLTGTYRIESVREHLMGGLVGRLINENRIVDQKKQINKAILLEMIRDLRERQLPHVFLLFESSVNFFNTSGWRMSLLTEILQREQVPYIAARDVVETFYIGDTYSPLLFMNGPRDFHPNGLYYRLVAEALGEILGRIQPDHSGFESLDAIGMKANSH